MPPPVKFGARVEPARARPVPFWRQGFELPPETSPRVFVAAVPRRRAANSARTDSWTSGPLKRAPNASSSSVTPGPPPSVGASAIAADLHEAAARTRHRAAHEQQVLGGAHGDDLEAALGDALVAHLPGAAQALEDPRRRRRRADRARRTDVVRPVAGGAAVEAMALDRALEALALRDPGDLDALPRLEHRHVDGVADGQPSALAAELAQPPQRRRVGLGEVAELPLRQRLLAGRAERELDGVVAVALGGPQRRHPARARLEDGDAGDAAVVAEDLRHAELAGEDGGHHSASRISMSTPAGRWSSRCSESTVFGVGWWISISRL